MTQSVTAAPGRRADRRDSTGEVGRWDAPAAPRDAAPPVRADLVTAGLAAVAALALLAVAGRLTGGVGQGEGAGRLADATGFSALVGLAVGLAASAARAGERTRPLARPFARLGGAGRSGHRTGAALLELVAPAAAGALVGLAAATAMVRFDIDRATVVGLLTSLTACVAFGGLVGGATRLTRPEGGQRCAATVGGACGGFVLWLATNALRGSGRLDIAARGWHTLTPEAIRHDGFLPHGVGVVLPALCVPLGIAGVDALQRLWRR